MKKFLALLLAFVFAFCVYGCKEKEEEVKLKGLTFETLEVTIKVEETATLKVVYDPTNVTNKEVKWDSDNTAVATVVNGVVTGVSEGTAHITATSVADTSIKASATITVTAKKDAPKVLTYEEYMAAEKGNEVTVEAYVQATQSWWDNKVTIYAQDDDGGYFFYGMACTETDFAKLTKGTKIRVTGTKAEWSGEIEVTDATFEIVSGTKEYEATDVSSLYGTEALVNKQNMFVSFKGLKVVASKTSTGEDAAYLYKYNGSGEEGDDLYFNVSDGVTTYAFTIESYLCNKDSEVYKTVKTLKIGDVIDVEGFLYWYNGVNPHITKVSFGVNALSYEGYMAVEKGNEVVVEAYVQATQSWWDNKVTVYAQDDDGGYFFYDMACTEADFAKLTKGTKIKVTGTKAEWSGEIEVTDATFEVICGSKVYEATDVTALLGTADLVKKQNMFVSFKGLTVVASKTSTGEDVAYLYKYNGSGEEGDDLYFNVSDGTNNYTFTVESYLCNKDSEVYKAVKALQIGDVIDLEGFLYWYNGVNPHITNVVKK